MLSPLKTVEFLRSVLPNEGYYCWWTKKDGFPQQGFASTVEQLCDILDRLDAAGFDAYFACSTYKEPVNRKAENVKYTKSFWLDIDAGPEKPYPDADHAVEALDAFCAQVQLPYPTVVYSGGGIHAYWPIDRQLIPSVWVQLARNLKSLTEGCGLKCDPSRTADVSSILRPPGTHNYKIPNTPRLVECDEIQPAGDIVSILERYNGRSFTFVAHPAIAEATPFDINKDALGGIKNNAPDMQKGYPDGYRTAELLKRIGWCLGPKRLTEEETLQACLAWNKFNTPPLEETKIQKTVESIAAREASKPTVIPEGVKPETFPQFIEGYVLDKYYRLTTVVETEDEQGRPAKKQVIISRWPVFVAEVRDGEAERNQGIWFRQWEPDRGWYDIEVPWRDYEGANRWGILAYHGIVIEKGSRPHFERYVHKQWAILSGAKVMRYDQFGWKEEFNSFLLGDTLYKNDGTKHRQACSREATTRAAKFTTSRQGSLSAWSAAANRFFKEGCEPISYALISGFSAPLMPFITPESDGGAVLSLLSPGSGTGKSTVLTAIASIWGELDGLRLTMRDTENARFRTIATLCNLPVICDELREGDKDVLPNQMIQGFTVGRDKLRARQDGTVNPVILSWKTLFISASNQSLVDALQKGGSEPLSARVFEIDTTAPKDAQFSFTNQLSDELILNRGYAGRAFIDYLMQKGVLEFARRNLYSLTEKYGAYLGARPPHRFIIRQLGANAVAAFIVRHMGILEFNEKRIMEWALEEAARAIKGIGEFNPVGILSNIINQNTISDCLIVQQGFSPRVKQIPLHKPTRSINMRRELATSRLYISAEFIKNELLKKGHSWMATAKVLEDQKILLERTRQVCLTANVEGLSSGRVPCWVIDMSNPLIGELAVKDVSSPAQESSVA